LSRGDIKKIYNLSRWQGLKKAYSLFSGIKREKFNVCLDFSLDHRYGLVAKLAGIKRRVGLNYKDRGRFLTDKIDIESYSGRHVVEYYLDLLNFLGVDSQSKDLYLSVPEVFRLRSKFILGRGGIKNGDLVVGIAPGAGASWGKDALLKHWAAIKFAQLADRLVEELGVKVVLLGDGLERPIADVVVNAMKNNCLDLIGKTNLEELLALVGTLKLLITNDGGPLHIAVAQGISTVSIFGPVDEIVYGPYPVSDRHIVIKSNISCRPCYRQFKMPVCDRSQGCLTSVSVEQVLEAAKQLLHFK
jgi:ADP-heptose:LPS heptosyltransferase